MQADELKEMAKGEGWVDVGVHPAAVAASSSTICGCCQQFLCRALRLFTRKHRRQQPPILECGTTGARRVHIDCLSSPQLLLHLGQWRKGLYRPAMAIGDCTVCVGNNRTRQEVSAFDKQVIPPQGRCFGFGTDPPFRNAESHGKNGWQEQKPQPNVQPLHAVTGRVFPQSVNKSCFAFVNSCP